MNRFALTTIAAVMLHTSAWGEEAPTPDNIKAVAGDYAKQLRANLMEQMSKNGLEGGITACSVKAAQLGAEASTRTGWSVRRVSSKARNPLAMSDAYEQEVLKGFEKEIASGKEDASRYEVVREGGIRYARFMKAVRVEATCLACHGGSEVAPNVEQKLSELYPHDTARGYKVGDLRGALSIKIKLD